MKIVRDHILSEFLSPFLSSVIGLLSMFLLGRGIIQMADFIFNKSVDAWLIAQLMFYTMPFMLIFVIPMSVLVATLLTFRKLSTDNELTALKASGVSLSKRKLKAAVPERAKPIGMFSNTRRMKTLRSKKDIASSLSHVD